MHASVMESANLQPVAVLLEYLPTQKFPDVLDLQSVLRCCMGLSSGILTAIGMAQTYHRFYQWIILVFVPPVEHFSIFQIIPLNL